MDAMCAAAGPWVRTAVDGLTVTVKPRAGRDPRTDGTGPRMAPAAPKLEGASG
jgi:hypothetical protein